jgi:diaminopimelate epimerase
MSAAIPFVKYQGAGNDFVVVDARRSLPGGEAPGVGPQAGGPGGGRGAGPQASALGGAEMSWEALAARVCERHFGVGADGLLVALTPAAPGAALRMRMYNPDGSEAEMCGNGLRCFGRWLLDRGEAGPGPLAVQTGAGVLALELGPDGQVATDMGPPRLAPADIPLSEGAGAGQPPRGPVLRLPLEVPPQPGFAGARFEATCVSMGNPHAVVFVPDPEAVALEVVGPLLETHPAFPARTNVELCQVLDRGRLRVRVWERGAGITLACGTGACAAVVAARLRGYVDEQVVVALPGGELEVTWPGAPLPVVLRGPAVRVFEGAFPL